MKNISILLFTVCSFIITTTAQTSVWKVTDTKGNKVYLGGTVHVLSPKDYPLPKEFYTAYDNADILAIEADIEKLEDPVVAQKIMSKIMYQDERLLTNVLDSTTYKMLEKECAKFNLPLSNLNKLKPSMVIVTITGMKLKASGITSEGVDKHFFTKAKNDKKEVLFLESIESQINLLSNMGEGNENDFVKKSLKDLSQTDALMGGLVSDWRNGESKIMDKQIDEMKNEYPKLHQDMLVKRNNNWIPVIDSYLSTNQIEFVLMGALHLHGESGILNQLKKKGYSVEKI